MPRRMVVMVVGLGLVAACSGSSAAPLPDGPPKLGVVAGNNQVVTAAPLVQNRLPQDVVAQAVRLPNGAVALRARVIDALLPEKAYAQSTPVNGIAGLVVCATTPDPKHALVAEVQCANTDATGRAYFTFHADTVAGVSKAQVAASTSTGTKVTDSLSATVLPGAAAGFISAAVNVIPPAMKLPANDFFTVWAHTGDTVNVRTSVMANVVDQYKNYLTSYRVQYRRYNWVCPTPLVNGSCLPGYDLSATDTAFVVSDKMVVRVGDASFDVAADTAVRRGIPVQVMPCWWVQQQGGTCPPGWPVR